MTGQQLKNSILQEAIEGRLVPQDPNDEPASVLLEKIRKEKARLVKEGKLKKKDLEETPISEDEIPFKIPKSWEWVRIGTIFNHSSGKQLSGSNTEGALREYITTSNLYWGRFELDNLKSMYYKDSELEKCTAKQGDLLVCEGGDIGRSAIWPYDYDICLQNHVHRLRPYDNRYTKLVFYIMWYYKSVGLIGGKGIGIQGLSASALKQIAIPLPPLAEQKRIVAKIEELLPKVEAYGKAQEALDKLNEELPERLKKSILQEAITGRLVPQDPNDEPASVLLDKIRAEKKRLVKEGKLKKKDLEETQISEDEKPFEIPESWEWVRIDQIATSQLGKTLDKGKQTGQEYPYLCSINVYWDGIDLSKVKSFLLREEELEKYKLKRGDLLVCEGGDYGRCSVWDSDDEMYYQNALHRIRFFGGLSVYFYKYIFEQYRNIDYIVGQGQTIKHFTYANMKSLAFPLPPLAEQHRIVEKIEQLMKEIDKLKV